MDRLSGDFVALVKDCLEHLYDPSHLQGHPLAAALGLQSGGVPPGASSRVLRDRVLDAIEALRPDRASGAHRRPGRAYQLLEMRYVQGLPFRDAMAELALSQRHYHREQHHAIEAVAAVLLESVRPVPSPSPDSSGSAVAPQPEPKAGAGDSEAGADVHESVRSALTVLAQVAAPRGIVVEDGLLSARAPTRCNRTAIRQAVIGVGGLLLAFGGGGRIRASSEFGAGGLTVALAWLPAQATDAPGQMPADRLRTAEALVAGIGGTLTVDQMDSGVTLSFTVVVHPGSLLVIDDNPDFCLLVARYMANRDVNVVGARSLREGLALAERIRPDVIVLDIMMPDQDGWDALQLLKHNPATADIPVVVCSVLGVREFAIGMGAIEFVQKPVSRDDWLDMLARLPTRSPPPGADSPE